MPTPQGLPIAAAILAMALPAASAQDVAYFESKVRPILADHCLSCHSAQAKPLRGGLRLDSRAGWEKGGDSGPASVHQESTSGTVSANHAGSHRSPQSNSKFKML